MSMIGEKVDREQVSLGYHVVITTIMFTPNNKEIYIAYNNVAFGENCYVIGI